MTNPTDSDDTTQAGLDSPLDDAIRSFASSVWWLVLLRGVLAIVFGVLAVVAPFGVLVGMAYVYGAYVLIDGVIAVAQAIATRKQESRWGWTLALGVLSIVAGIVVMLFPVVAGIIGGITVVLAIALSSIVVGAVGIPAAANLTAGGGRKALAIVTAVLTLVLGAVLLVMAFASPGATVESLIWVIGISAIAFGVVLIMVAVQTRRAVKR